MREKVGLTALLALIVVLCPVFAIGQRIVGEREALFAVLPKEGRDRVAAIDPGLNELNGRLTAAENRAKKAQTDASDAKASADQATNGVHRLNRRVGLQGKDILKLDSAVFGKKGKNGKRSGGLVKTTAELVDWKKTLITAACTAGYTDGGGGFNAGKFFEAEEKQNTRLSKLENNSATKEELANQASRWTGWVATLALFFGASAFFWIVYQNTLGRPTSTSPALGGSGLPAGATPVAGSPPSPATTTTSGSPTVPVSSGAVAAPPAATVVVTPATPARTRRRP